MTQRHCRARDVRIVTRLRAASRSIAWIGEKLVTFEKHEQGIKVQYFAGCRGDPADRAAHQYVLVIKLKTAEALGLNLSSSLLVAARGPIKCA
jgi:hypothetical protein